MKHVILIGFMGAGKTSIGKKLARRQDCRFVDTDLLIEKEQGCRISEIFEKHGEKYFRDLETETLKKLLSEQEPMVIAVGGGLPVREENRRLMAKLGMAVYMKASAETLYRRLQGDQKRPLLQGGDLKERILTLMDAREEIYEDAAQITYCTDGKTFKQTVEELNELILQESL
ncbi:MAG: shikimate kinase [Eubacteriales bacterium]|nr:shikimate kinase [Eubacteriales bacterium]